MKEKGKGEEYICGETCLGIQTDDIKFILYVSQ